jgi:hypothetical protein
MATVLKTINVTTRKSRQCSSCLRQFPSKTKMQYQVCIYEGDFCTTYLCQTCIDILAFSDETEWEGGFVDNKLEQDQTPEDLLIELRKQCK